MKRGGGVSVMWTKIKIKSEFKGFLEVDVNGWDSEGESKLAVSKFKKKAISNVGSVREM